MSKDNLAGLTATALLIAGWSGVAIIGPERAGGPALILLIGATPLIIACLWQGLTSSRRKRKNSHHLKENTAA